MVKASCQRASGGRLSSARDAVDDPVISHDENLSRDVSLAFACKVLYLLIT
jgi:hypothetical protein